MKERFGSTLIHCSMPRERAALGRHWLQCMRCHTSPPLFVTGGAIDFYHVEADYTTSMFVVEPAWLNLLSINWVWAIVVFCLRLFGSKCLKVLIVCITIHRGSINDQQSLALVVLTGWVWVGGEVRSGQRPRTLAPAVPLPHLKFQKYALL